MRICPAYPEKNDMARKEIFDQKEYKEMPQEEKDRIKLQSAQFRYDYENLMCFFDKYFPNFNTNEFNNKSVLDLGSFTGGRLVYWAEKYQFGEAYGIDISPVFAEAGNLFAKHKGINAHFDTGFGEDLPYESSYFDFVITYDVFEHVQNVEKVMDECFRVLKSGGRLLAVFPQFFQPLEAHLGMITKMLALHWFFSGDVITEVYYETGQQRGLEASWYARKNPKLDTWERLPSLNGITIGKFRRIIKKNNWNLNYWRTDPILSDGRRSNQVVFRLLRTCFIIPARLPILEELFLSRIGVILEKPDFDTL